MLDNYNLEMLVENVVSGESEANKKIANFFVDLVLKLEKGDPEAKRLINLPPDELKAMISQQEAPIQEAFFGGNSKDPVMTAYENLIKSINKHIWELEQDLKVAKVEDTSTYAGLLKNLQNIEPSIQAEGGFFQKIGHKIGRGVGFASKRIGLIGGMGALLSSIGLPAYAVGGIIGGGLNFLKNSQNANMDTKTKLKKALVAAGLGALTGYAISHLDQITGQTTTSVNNSIQGDTVSGNPDIHLFRNQEKLPSLVDQWLTSKNIPHGDVTIDGTWIKYETPDGTSYIDMWQLKPKVSDLQDGLETANPKTLAGFIHQNL